MIIGQQVKFMKKMKNNKKPKNTTEVSLSTKENMDGSITLSLVPKNVPTKNSFKKPLNEVYLPVYHHVYGNDSLEECDI